MKILRVGMVAALAAAVVVLAVACGGDDGATVDQFVNKVYEIDKAHEVIAEPLRAELGAHLEGVVPDQTLPAGTTDVFTKIFDEETDFADKVEAVNAPKEHLALRDEVVASMRAEVAYGRGVLATFNDETTVGDFEKAFEGDEATAIEERRSNGCLSLQKLADDNGIVVDMTC
jgi:hypothetical protein